MFSNIFHVILYQPIFNLFVWLYNVVPAHDIGVVILIITLLVRLLLYPLTASSIKAQKSLQDIQPKMDELKKQHADDKQKQAQALMDLYKNNKVNPFSSCLPLLIQLPILIALFWVLRDALASNHIADNLYSFVQNPGTINPVSFGFNVGKPSVLLAILAGLAQFVQTKTLSRKQPPKEAGAGAKDEDMMARMNKQMLYFMPVMTTIFGLQFPAGLTLYWFFSTVFTIGQQLLITRKSDKNSAINKGTPAVIEGEIVK